MLLRPVNAESRNFLFSRIRFDNNVSLECRLVILRDAMMNDLAVMIDRPEVPIQCSQHELFDFVGVGGHGWPGSFV